jgi:hypothetical protein
MIMTQHTWQGEKRVLFCLQIWRFGNWRHIGFRYPTDYNDKKRGEKDISALRGGILVARKDELH